MDIIQLDTRNRRICTQDLDDLTDSGEINFGLKVGDRYADHVPVAIPDESVGIAAGLECNPFLADAIDVAALHADQEGGGSGGLHGELQLAAGVAESRQVVLDIRREGHSRPTEPGRLETDILRALIRILRAGHHRVGPDEDVAWPTQGE